MLCEGLHEVKQHKIITGKEKHGWIIVGNPILQQ